MPHRNYLYLIFFYLWSIFVLAAYFVVQKPFGSQQLHGLMITIWTIALVAAVFIVASGLGSQVFKWIGRTNFSPSERLILGFGIGLALFSFVGLVLSIVGWIHSMIFGGIFILVSVVLYFTRSFHMAYEDAHCFWIEIKNSFSSIHPLFKLVLGILLFIAFVQALAPPDAFDGLMYHLELPARILHDGRLQPYDMAQFWFPGMPENLFLWFITLGTDRAPQMTHLIITVLAALVIWLWSRVWNDRVAWLAIAILISMPSLALLSSWAYTDFFLTYLTLACLYSAVRFGTNSNNPWIYLSGFFAGLAMGVKYTSFLLPVAVIVLLIWWNRKEQYKAFMSIIAFGTCALVVAMPWYLRNWLFMQNPFYPFLLGGRYWDSLRAALYSMNGTGIGWNLKELFLLPLTATLGYRDANYYDGRIGPFYLLLAPLLILAYWKITKDPLLEQRSLIAILFFSIASFAMWTLGVVNTHTLWQTRLLFPAIFPLSIPLAVGIRKVARIDTGKFKASFLLYFVVAAVIGLVCIENLQFFALRNPLSVVIGSESEKDYLNRVNPRYEQMLDLLADLPPDAIVYSLFEPRSFRSPVSFQPDVLVDQFARDVNLFGSNQNIVQAWRSKGYTHVLVYRWGVTFLHDNQPSVLTPEREAQLDNLTGELLTLLEKSAGGDYELYKIPPSQ